MRIRLAGDARNDGHSFALAIFEIASGLEELFDLSGNLIDATDCFRCSASCFDGSDSVAFESHQRDRGFLRLLPTFRRPMLEGTMGWCCERNRF